MNEMLHRVTWKFQNGEFYKSFPNYRLATCAHLFYTYVFCISRCFLYKLILDMTYKGTLRAKITQECRSFFIYLKMYKMEKEQIIYEMY